MLILIHKKTAMALLFPPFLDGLRTATLPIEQSLLH